VARFQWTDWKEYLLPPEGESEDPAFHSELERLSVLGLEVSSWFGVGAAIFMLTVTTFLSRLGYLSHVMVATDLAIVAMCLLVFPFWLVRRLQRYARLAGCFLSYSVALTFIVTAAADPTLPGVTQTIPYNIVLVMLFVLASLPLRPLETLALGAALLGSYLGAMILFPQALFVPDVTPLFLASIVLVILVCTGLAAVIYRQRALTFRARQQVLHAQAQLALAESAAAQGRLAAALSHDLNSPIGALVSNLSTLGSALQKSRRGEQTSDQLIRILGEIQATAMRACQRLKEIVGRMQRYTHLDRAEEAKVDLTMLLRDTAETLSRELEDIELVLMLDPIPTLLCRPQQMSAVFTNLLLNSRNALGGKGAVHVRSMSRGEEIVIEVEDDGCGIPAERVARIFEPSFNAEGGRVSVSNWGLFNCRSIIHRLGGDIAIDSIEGKGTVVRITLPTSYRHEEGETSSTPTT
jgi:signal transduction histidine kinase